MKSLIFAFSIIATSISVSPMLMGATMRIDASFDATVSEANPDTNYGNHNSLNVGSYSDQAW